MTDQIHELSITRYIAAPPAKIWHAWTDRLPEWWVPKPWTVEVVAHELWAGGRSSLIMRGPDGEQNDAEGVFLEVVPERKAVFTNAFAAGWVPQTPFMVGIIEFTPEGDGTRYTATARHWDEAAMENHKAMGFEQGWGKVADQLAELVE